jgi:hypothetical protein
MPIIECSPPLGNFYLSPEPLSPAGLYGRAVDIDTPSSDDLEYARLFFNGFTRNPDQGRRVRIRFVRGYTKSNDIQAPDWTRYCFNTRLVGLLDKRGVWILLRDDDMPIAWCPYPRARTVV